MVEANQLSPSPKNYRRHPPEQRKALKAILDELGFAGAMLVRDFPTAGSSYAMVTSAKRCSANRKSPFS